MQSVETVKRTIQVKIKQVYGNKTVYILAALPSPRCHAKQSPSE